MWDQDAQAYHTWIWNPRGVQEPSRKDGSWVVPAVGRTDDDRLDCFERRLNSLERRALYRFGQREERLVKYPRRGCPII